MNTGTRINTKTLPPIKSNINSISAIGATGGICYFWEADSMTNSNFYTIDIDNDDLLSVFFKADKKETGFYRMFLLLYQLVFR